MRKRFLSAFLVLVLLFSTVPTAAAASTEPDLTCKVYYGDEVKLPRSKFVDLLDTETGDDDLGYIEITDVSSDFDDYGWFSALDRNGNKTELKKAYDLETYYYYDDDWGFKGSQVWGEKKEEKILSYCTKCGQVFVVDKKDNKDL